MKNSTVGKLILAVSFSIACSCSGGVASEGAGSVIPGVVQSSTSEVVLRDKLGNRIGTIEVQSDGRQVGRDGLGNRVGEYNPKDNVTRDRLGNRFGEGNLLAVLIAQANK